MFKLIVIIPTLIYAFYNPFFIDDAANKEKIIQVVEPKKKVYTRPYKAPKRTKFKMTYYGFVESAKGKFALVTFNNKNIVITKNDSIYKDQEIFKILKITSNSILLKDKRSKLRTVYFSSQDQYQQQQRVTNQ